MKSVIKEWGRSLLSPLARVLANIGVSPNHLTLAGLVASAGAGVLVAFGYFLSAAAALFLGSLCDMLDGAVARASGRSSQFGAFLDSTVDRYGNWLRKKEIQPAYWGVNLTNLSARVTLAQEDEVAVPPQVHWMSWAV